MSARGASHSAAAGAPANSRFKAALALATTSNAVQPLPQMGEGSGTDDIEANSASLDDPCIEVSPSCA